MRRLVLLACVTGCDPLAGAEYVGDPLFTLTGSFATPVAPAAPVGGVALMWQDTAAAGGPGVAITAVPVAIEFPSTFRVAVPVPPPDAARFAFADGVELAEAYVYVVDDPGAELPVPRGLARTHVLVYASADVEPGTEAADYLGGPLPAGYHLRRFSRTPPGAAQQQMIDRCAATAARAACVARRGYQLAPAADDEHVRIVVTP